MRRKLMNAHGESIAESLVSILIVAVASILFAGMVTASQKVIEQSTNWMTDYYAAVSAINNQKELPEGGDAKKRVRKQENVQISIAGNTKNEEVTAFINEDLGAYIVSYIKEK